MALYAGALFPVPVGEAEDPVCRPTPAVLYADTVTVGVRPARRALTAGGAPGPRVAHTARR